MEPSYRPFTKRTELLPLQQFRVRHVYTDWGKHLSVAQEYHYSDYDVVLNKQTSKEPS